MHGLKCPISVRLHPSSKLRLGNQKFKWVFNNGSCVYNLSKKSGIRRPKDAQIDSAKRKHIRSKGIRFVCSFFQKKWGFSREFRFVGRRESLEQDFA
eukprot:6481349-Amphidinium_carterae.1